MLLRLTISVFVLLSASFPSTTALNNGLGLVPSMGFNTWYDVFMNPTEDSCLALVDAIKATGLYDAGYHYFNLDDGVFSGRDANGTLVANPSQFPNGIQSLVDRVHAAGMKFGIYTDRGTQTCGGRPGAQGYETIDANFYASIGVDFLKEDSCNASPDEETAFAEYARMRDALNKTGRPIYFNLCGWNTYYAPIGHSLANSWRTGGDDGNWEGILGNVDNAAGIVQYQGPGGFNDLDYLLGKNAQGGVAQTDLQARAQFSLYSVITSPLIISQDLTKISDYSIVTYTNREVIAVNQDPRGAGGIRLVGGDLRPCINGSTCLNVWGKPLVDGSWVITVVNAGSQVVTNFTCGLATNCLTATGWLPTQKLVPRDLWQHQDLPGVQAQQGVVVPSLQALGGSAMFKLTPVW